MKGNFFHLMGNENPFTAVKPKPRLGGEPHDSDVLVADLAWRRSRYSGHHLNLPGSANHISYCQQKGE